MSYFESVQQMTPRKRTCGQLFVEPEVEFENVHQQFSNAFNRGDNEEVKKILSQIQNPRFEEWAILKSINLLTGKNGFFQTRRIERFVKERFKFEYTKAKKKQFPNIIKTENHEIEFKKISDFLDSKSLKGIFADLVQPDRPHQCHARAVQMSWAFENFPNEIVTGYVRTFDDDLEYLHSWLEVVNSNGIRAVDYNDNMTMSKDDFDALYKPKVITRITNEQLNEDKRSGMLDLMFQINDGFKFTDKEYVAFRHEIVRDLKNKFPQKESKKPN